MKNKDKYDFRKMKFTWDNTKDEPYGEITVGRRVVYTITNKAVEGKKKKYITAHTFLKWLEKEDKNVSRETVGKKNKKENNNGKRK
jgi:hypothetical protein